MAATLNLLPTVGTTLAAGTWLNAATATKPVCVLGAAAAQRLGIDKVLPGERIWIDDQWFYVAGILRPAVLAPAVDGSILVGFEAAATYLGFDGHPTQIYVRSATDQTEAVHGVLGATANPVHPDAVRVSQPSDALVARAKAKGRRAMCTVNDEPNKAMRGINAKLGYVTLPANVELEKKL